MINNSVKSILFLIPTLSGGGSERVTANIANALSKDYKITVCVFKRTSKEYKTDDNIDVVYIPKLKEYSIYWFLFTFYRKGRLILGRIFPSLFTKKFVDGYCLYYIKHLKKKLKPYVTISMLSAANAINARIPGGKRIMSERNDPRWTKDKTDNLINLRSYKHADIVVFQTNEVKSLFPKEIQEKGVVIKNPISVDAINYNNTSKKIVNVGRLHWQKDQPMLIKAFSKFHSIHKDYSLYIYGEGSDRKKLENLISDLNLRDSVFLPGFVSDIRSSIADAKMFVLSSAFEGLPNALMEAMMMGLPIISTACNGSKELIENEVNGLLVPVGDIDSLWHAMERLVFNGELCKDLSENSKLFSKSFKTEKIIEKWKQLLV